jgi:hypothetical protein
LRGITDLGSPATGPGVVVFRHVCPDLCP